MFKRFIGARALTLMCCMLFSFGSVQVVQVQPATAFAAVVHDPAAMVQQLLQLGAAIKQAGLQLYSYKRQYDQLKAQLQELKDLDFSELNEFIDSIENISSFMDFLKLVGESFDYIKTNWDEVYDASNPDDPFGFADLTAKEVLWSKMSEMALKDSIESASTTLKLQSELAKQIKALETKSRNTSGGLQATKVNSQLLSSIARQQQLANAQTVRDAHWQKLEHMKTIRMRKAQRDRHLQMIGEGFGMHKPKVGPVELPEFD